MKNVASDSERAIRLKAMKYVIDRQHIKNHQKECHDAYDADLYEELNKINTIVCEQTNFWLGGYKHI